MKILNHCRHAAHMVAMGMRQRNGIQTTNVPPPEILRDDVLADIEMRIAGSGATDGAARIYQQRVAIGSDNEQRVSLTDIQRGDLQIAMMKRWLLRPQYKQGVVNQMKQSSEFARFPVF